MENIKVNSVVFILLSANSNGMNSTGKLKLLTSHINSKICLLINAIVTAQTATNKEDNLTINTNSLSLGLLRNGLIISLAMIELDVLIHESADDWITARSPIIINPFRPSANE